MSPKSAKEIWMETTREKDEKNNWNAEFLIKTNTELNANINSQSLEFRRYNSIEVVTLQPLYRNKFLKIFYNFTGKKYEKIEMFIVMISDSTCQRLLQQLIHTY